MDGNEYQRKRKSVHCTQLSCCCNVFIRLVGPEYRSDRKVFEGLAKSFDLAGSSIFEHLTKSLDLDICNNVTYLNGTYIGRNMRICIPQTDGVPITFVVKKRYSNIWSSGHLYLNV